MAWGVCFLTRKVTLFLQTLKSPVSATLHFMRKEAISRERESEFEGKMIPQREDFPSEGVFGHLAPSFGEGKPGGFENRGFPTFLGKVRVVSRTLSGLFLIGAFNAMNSPRKRTRTNGENPWKLPRKSRNNPENHRKRTRRVNKRAKRKDKSRLGNPPRFKPPVYQTLMRRKITFASNRFKDLETPETVSRISRLLRTLFGLGPRRKCWRLFGDWSTRERINGDLQSQVFFPTTLIVKWRAPI